MTTLAHPPPTHSPAQGTPVATEPAVGTFIRGVSWETYERLRNETDAAGQIIYITYDRGTMLLMPPLFDHEVWKKLIGRMVEAIAEEMDVPIRSAGSTTLKRADLERGLEADESYYVQREAVVRDKRVLDLTGGDPPPDLAIEVERTYSPLNKPSVYAALGVNEVWRYNGTRIAVLVLDPAAPVRSYREVEQSVAFPFLKPADLAPFVRRAFETHETAWIREFRAWVRATYVPKTT